MCCCPSSAVKTALFSHADGTCSSVGLVLSFPREPDRSLYPKVFSSYESIKRIMEKTDGWSGCVSTVELSFANITKEEDSYGDYFSRPGGYRNWVNGPNRQFERLFRYIQSERFDVWYLMEPDSYPRRNFWLDSLVNEIRTAAPFAILGSKYDGEAWNYFHNQLSTDVLHHINGNGVYNVTDPMLLEMMSELEAEAKTIFNAVPFDLRLSQMMLEGASGKPCPFMFNSKKHNVTLPDKSAKFVQLWEDHGGSSYGPVKESHVITNRASHVYMPQDLDEYILVHGKKIYLPWSRQVNGVRVISYPVL